MSEENSQENLSVPLDMDVDRVTIIYKYQTYI
jgi:hypothetical protein